MSEVANLFHKEIAAEADADQWGEACPQRQASRCIQSSVSIFSVSILGVQPHTQ